MKFLCQSFRWMPLILCIAMPVSVFITYGMALAMDHVSPLWPYISDTGTVPPESCVFSLFLNLISFLLCIVVYLRYLEIAAILNVYQENSGAEVKKYSIKRKKLWNSIASVLGYLSCFGLALVACFQETNQLIVHLIGALLCFLFGTFYFLAQTWFTYLIEPKAKVLLWLRVIFTILNVVFIAGTFAPLKAAFENFKGKDVLKWTYKDGGFTYHLISTFSEWLLVFSFCAYVSTIFWDFRKIKIVPPTVKIFMEYRMEGGSAKNERSNLELDENNEENSSQWI